MCLKFFSLFLFARHLFQFRNRLAPFYPVHFLTVIVPSWTYPSSENASKWVFKFCTPCKPNVHLGTDLLLWWWTYMVWLLFRPNKTAKVCFNFVAWIFLWIKFTFYVMETSHMLGYCKSEVHAFSSDCCFYERGTILTTVYGFDFTNPANRWYPTSSQAVYPCLQRKGKNLWIITW